MKTITVELKYFSELSPEVQKEVIERERESCASGHMDFISSEFNRTVEKVAEIFDFKYRTHSHYSTFYYTCSSSCCATGNRLYRRVAGIYEYYCTRPKTYTLPSGKKRLSKIFREVICCPFTGVFYDESVMDFLKSWLSTPHIYDSKGYPYEYTDFCEELMAIFPPLYEQEEEYAYSDENVSESIMANEMDEEYLENGLKYLG